MEEKSSTPLNLNDFPFINREISWLYFNKRVLYEANNPNVPLLERLKFLGIFSSNLDEFYMIRVAGVKEQIEAKYIPQSINELIPSELLNRINNLTQQLIDEQQDIFLKLKKICRQKNIIFFDKLEEIDDEISDYAEEIWLQEIMPKIEPVIIGPTKPFPFVYNKSLNVFVELKKGENTYYSIIMLGNLKRIHKVHHDSKLYIIFTEQVLLKFINRIFSSYAIKSSCIIRITRNADFNIEEGAEDLLETIEYELSKRKKGNIVRFETNLNLNSNSLFFLKSKLNFNERDIINVKYTMDLSCLNELNINRKSLLYKPIKPYIPADIHLNSSIFKIIKKKDIILYRPYINFSIISKLVEISSNDANVIAIKMTLYRTNENSSIIKSLVNAAKKGKQVSVIIELKARFDEEKNIEWSKILVDAGCIVTYGVMDLKLHTKNLLIIRKENKRIVKYCHISTGNYNEITANIYTDADYLTADESVGADISILFNNLMGYSELNNYKRISVSPAMIRNDLIKLIDDEIEFAKKGISAKIIVKINTLTDKKIISKLYEASMAGVKIIMIIRGICCLIPGIAEVSENITVKSIIGRLLEHARILYFYAGGKEKIFISTADWMERNMDNRIELLFEILDIEAKEKLKNILDCNIKDNAKSWVLLKDLYIKMEIDKKQKYNNIKNNETENIDNNLKIKGTFKEQSHIDGENYYFNCQEQIITK
ncbi:MAG: polyphosphate kinase 1 [bacterium]